MRKMYDCSWAVRVVGVILLACGAGGCASFRADRWIRVETEHVTLRTDVREDVARDAVAKMQRTRDAFSGAVLPCAFARPSRIEVTILASSGDYDAVGASWSDGYVDNEAAFLDATPSRVVMRGSRPERAHQLFQHELAHTLAHACMVAMPTWLNEGLAEFLETAVVDDTSITLGIPPYVFRSSSEHRVFVYRGVEVVTLGIDALQPASALIAMTPDVFYQDGIRNGYRQEETRLASYASAWAVVHFFELAPRDVRERFARYLSSLRRPEVDPVASWAREMRGLDVEAGVAAHVTRESVDFLTVPLTERAPPAVRVTPMSAGEAHIEWARLWWRRGDEARRARMRAHARAALDDPQTRVAARVMLAADALRQRPTLALEELETGLRSDPEHPALLAMMLEIALRGAEVDPAARGSALALAARLEPVAQSGAQLALVAIASLLSGDVERAIAQSTRAVALDEACFRCHLTQGRALAAAERSWPAVSALERALACLPHDDASERDRVRGFIRELVARAPGTRPSAE